MALAMFQKSEQKHANPLEAQSLLLLYLIGQTSQDQEQRNKLHLLVGVAAKSHCKGWVKERGKLEAIFCSQSTTSIYTVAMLGVNIPTSNSQTFSTLH